MSVSTDFSTNKIVYDTGYKAQFNHILDKFLFDYGDEFATMSFLEKYHQAIADLEYVNSFDGRLNSPRLTKLGFRRKMIKKYHYVIIYKYSKHLVQLRYIFPSMMDYLKLIV